MKPTVTLSIVTVTFNDLDALKKTVRSVVDLEFGQIEYVVVDGGSTDGTREYLESLSLPYLTWVSERDDGIFDAFNKGIKMASGSWVHLLNAGDVYAHSDVFAKTDFWIEKDFLCFSVLKRKKKDFVWSPKPRYGDAFVDVAHPGLLVRRDYYLSVSMYPVGYRFVSDSFFIWHNVTPTRTVVYQNILVDMADGGYSTKWHARHEVEKQLLIYSAPVSRLNRGKLHLKYLLAGVSSFLIQKVLHFR